MKAIKGTQLKQDGVVIASGTKNKIIRYQEQNHRQRTFTYIVTIRGERYCKIRRLTPKETQQYKNQIDRENGKSTNNSNKEP